jgi:ATP-dependent protease ClpP protease subunit
MPAQRSIRSYPHVASGRRADESPRDWEIVICGDLTDKQVDLTERLISVPRRSKGTIFFDSCGGSAYVGLSLAALIRLRGLDPIGVVTGECSSAALFPFAACRQRYVLASSTLLFHPIRWHSEENVRVEEAAEWARHFQQLEPALDAMLARMFECPIEQVNEWTRPGRFVTGQELAAAGLAQVIDLFAGDVWRQLATHGSE